MRIAYCAQSKIPSKEANSIHVMKMCHALAKQAHDIELVVPNQQTEAGNPFDFYGVSNIFNLKYIKWPKIKFGVFIFSLRVIRYLRKRKVDAVYGRDLTTCFFAAACGIPTIWESHEPVEYMTFPYTWFFKQMVKKKSFLKIVVITSTLKKYYIEMHGFSPDKVVVLPDCSDAVDLGNTRPIEFEKNSYKANVGYIGQLYPGKGMEILSQLIPLCPNVMFHIIGGNEKDVNNWKEKLTGFKNVKFYGFVKPSETVLYGLSMDILIAPYMKKVQGAGAKQFESDLSNWMSPLKIFEYMSYKKPIIATDLPVLHDVLNEKNSIMCDPDNMQAWADAINKLVTNPTFAKGLAEVGYNDFINNYTWDIRAKKMIAMYM